LQRNIDGDRIGKEYRDNPTGLAKYLDNYKNTSLKEWERKYGKRNN
jgi:hypothetical protein